MSHLSSCRACCLIAINSHHPLRDQAGVCTQSQPVPDLSPAIQVQDKIKDSCQAKLRQVHEAFQTVMVYLTGCLVS